MQQVIFLLLVMAQTYGHIGFEYFEQTGYYVYFTLPYVPRDITTTDNFVVLAGDFSTSGTVNVFAIQPFPKNIIPPAYLPYYSYAVGNPPTMVEPYNYHLRIVDIGNDDVATLTHRLDYVSGIYYMALREYDVSNAFSNYDVPMTASYLMKYNYSIGDYHDFRYDAANMTFSVFQDFEVTPSNSHDVVTKINFSSGVPATVQSDYLALSGHVMKSMSLSDSAMYAVYGYDAVSKANVFWKDYQTISVPGSCLNNAVLPFYTDTPVSVERVDMNIFTPLPASLSIINSAPVIISERIVNICH